MNDKQETALLRFLDTIKGLVTADDFITAAILVSKVKTAIRDNCKPETSEAVYTDLLKAVDQMGVRNPFRDQEQFFLIYKEAARLEALDWERAIAYMAPFSRLPVLPPVLVNVFAERFAINPKTVLIAEAEKFVPSLQHIVDGNKASRFVLTTNHAEFELALQNVFAGYDNVEVIRTDIYSYGFMNRRFDLIFASPIFGCRTLTENQYFMCREYDMTALENLSLHLSDGGRLVITLPARVTFASGKVNDLRKFIQQSYTIKEIAELPVGTVEGSAIKLYLLDIENTRPGDDDIVVRRYDGKREKKGCLSSLEIVGDTFVMLSELEEQGDWNLERIFAQQDEDYRVYRNSSVRKEKIGSVAQVFRGKSVNRKDPAGSIGVVNISNIGDYEIDYDGLEHLQEEDRKVASYLLREGDVLLPARGTTIRTAVFHEKAYPCIASSNIIVIRPDPKMLDSTYLKIFLDSPIGNKIISAAQQGMIVMNISYKDLNALEIPLPPLERQQEAVKEYLKELQIYRDTISAAKERWTEVLAKLQKF
ncbi:MAG: restriction endonuclease subunit S [bacterium]|nr:restriction endonuclease subunit S [bacterium]